MKSLNNTNFKIQQKNCHELAKYTNRSLSYQQPRLLESSVVSNLKNLWFVRFKMSQQEGQSRRRRSPRVSSSSSRSNESLHSPKINENNSNKTPLKDGGGSGRKGNFSKKGVHRTSSNDQVRKLVEKEGRTARNLVTWSVPVNNDHYEERAKRSKPRIMTRKRQVTPEQSGSSERDCSPASKSSSKSPNRGRAGRKTSTSSTGKKSDLRARYWSYLFDNLKRAVDEIYSTCETDESTVECEEVIMMLDQCRRDFAALIERICLQDAFEKADYKDRPTSLAWEVRKSSPGKSLVTSPCTVQPITERSAQSPVRSLNFSTACTTANAIAPKPTVLVQSNVIKQNGPSWADRVKGTQPTVANKNLVVPSSTTAFTKSQELHLNGVTPRSEDDQDDGTDEEGWETVRHGKKHTPQGTHGNLRGSQQRNKNSPEKKEVHNHLVNGYRNDNVNGNVDGKDFTKLSVNANTTPRKISLTSEEEELATHLDDSDLEQEQALDLEHQKAISDALEEEENLTKEIEEWQEQALASAIEHEQSLAREIAKEEAFVTALNGEGETPTSELETETEGEGEGEGDENSTEAGEMNPSLEDSSKAISWEDLVANYEAGRETGMSWGDAVELSDERPPGRAVAMHQKLSAPNRKRPLEERIRIHEEKQFKAQQKREKLLEERLQKLQMLSEKVEKVRDLQVELIQSRHLYLSEKQKRAEQLRMTMIKEKVRKARGEEAKVNEIAFINTLEAQNKKIEVMSRIQEHEARLQDLQEERQRKREEQQAKEAAAQERRRQLEAERLARLEEMQQRKLEQEAKYKKEKMEKEKAREEAAREKARDREMRIAARNEALQTAAEQLQIKIKQKQTDCTRRHEQQLEQVKEKAAGISRHPTQEEVPTVTPYETKKMCTLCNVEIVSEVYLYSHLRGKRHQQALALLESSGSKGLNEDKLLHRNRALFLGLQKIVKDLNRYLQVQGSGPWPSSRVSSLDRSVGELMRILEEKVDKFTFCSLGGLSALSQVLSVVDISGTKPSSTPVISNRVLCHVIHASTQACLDCQETSQYMVFTNKLASAIDLLAYQLRNVCTKPPTPETNKKTSDKETKDASPRRLGDTLVTALLGLLATVMDSLAQSPKDDKNSSSANQRNLDLVSYIVCSDLIDDIRALLSSIQEPLDEEPSMMDMVHNCIKLLSSIAYYLGSRSSGVFETKKEDATQFVMTFQQTELVGIISTLYTMLMTAGQARHFSPPPSLPEYQIKVATEGLRALNNMAKLDLKILQSSLGGEGVSLEFRHILSYLLWICGEGTPEELLHEVILVIGYFTVLNNENQVFIQSGRNPTLLQQLCGLPFQYFSDPRLRNILFPTFIASCYENEENKTIIEQEVSCALLENFLQDKMLDSQEEENSSPTKMLSAENSPDRYSLNHRFPPSLWAKAGEFLRGSS
ncbi:S phase cyclin A-associated protein in the endoplasmic reticulum-like [Actinia tenebrosa]|uniref:S phase cyclin A-associated protein in the endoplasmic reticulum-like n=1 Tax=Actinia tenebrosa TaxID=6105 RepID=A0A6P8H726_ACTTE|nr:S phase cyclin A-associated protein in the endoplasmic reticulum-like [Actinia tenebrosa]